MGTVYKIRCKHCGTQFDHYAGSDYGTTICCVGCESYVETETAIRCPACFRKLNNSPEEFNQQVEVVTMWD